MSRAPCGSTWASGSGRVTYESPKGANEKQCVEQEYRAAVRQRVGLIDVSTLGKLDLKGRDVGQVAR